MHGTANPISISGSETCLACLVFQSLSGSAADVDGLVIHYTAFGTLNTAAPFEMGRTAVHEVGHWLGLKHIWGDTYCGDDLVDDTPRQAILHPVAPMDSGRRATTEHWEICT